MSICCTAATSGSRYLSGLLVNDMALCFSKKACRDRHFHQLRAAPAGGATSSKVIDAWCESLQCL